MSLSYETAVKLKEAGFPQKEYPGILSCVHELPDDVFINDKLHSCYNRKEKAYKPTLSELIEACGDNFVSLSKGMFPNQWMCLGNGAQAGGVNAKEAVAALWLEVNKK